MNTQATIDKLNQLSVKATRAVSALAVADDRAKSAAENYKAALQSGAKLLGRKIESKTAAEEFAREIEAETAKANRLSVEMEASLAELNGLLGNGGDDASDE